MSLNIHYSYQDLEAVQMSNDRGVNKQIMVYMKQNTSHIQEEILPLTTIHM